MNPSTSALLTDLYELTMAQAYLEQGMEEPAVFEFFVRKLPIHRNFLVAAGLEQVLDYLSDLHVTREELVWLERSGRFSSRLLHYLETLRFTGDVEAMPEGTIFFPHEPILRIVAPLPQAQLVESRVMNLLNFQTMVASKAARSVLVARGKPLIDFGLRRAHGAEAGLLASRASYLAGSLELQPSSPAWFTEFLSMARWPTHSCKPTKMNSWLSSTLPRLNQTMSFS
jgi:nicotinate phosphoribosyltransferase